MYTGYIRENTETGLPVVMMNAVSTGKYSGLLQPSTLFIIYEPARCVREPHTGIPSVVYSLLQQEDHFLPYSLVHVPIGDGRKPKTQLKEGYLKEACVSNYRLFLDKIR